MKRMKINSWTVLSFVVCALLLSACRSSRHASRENEASTEVYNNGETGGKLPTSETVTTPSKDAEKDSKKDKNDKKRKKQDNEKAQSRKTSAEAMTAKMDLTLKSGSKSITVGGNYRLKRNEMVQINLVVSMIISVNVGTLELTPDYILVIDRLHKRYCKVAYTDVPSLGQAGIDFNYLQRVFWGEAEESPIKEITWKYDNWLPLADGQFPGKLQFALKTSGASYQAQFDLRNLSVSDNWSTRTEVSSKYTAVSLEDIMKTMMTVTGQ